MERFIEGFKGALVVVLLIFVALIIIFGSLFLFDLGVKMALAAGTGKALAILSGLGVAILFLAVIMGIINAL